MRPKNKSKTTPISFRTSKLTRLALCRLARRRKVSLAEMVRLMVEEQMVEMMPTKGEQP